MKFYTRLLYIVVLSMVFTSCVSVKKGESVILRDAVPPAGYSPVFITQAKAFEPATVTKPELEISWIEAKQFESNVKFFLHLTEEQKTYLLGASDKINSKFWCGAYLTFEGKRQPVNFKLSEINNSSQRKNAVAIAMDHSGSMGNERAKIVQGAISKLIENKRDQDAMSLIRYDHRIITKVPLTNSKQQLLANNPQNGLEGFNGFTAIVDAAEEGVKQLSGKGYDNNTLVIFTDGFDNSSNSTPDSLINHALMKNVKIFGVDFGENINEDYVKNLALGTGGRYNRIYNRNEFDLLFQDLYYRLNNAYVLEVETDYYGPHFIEINLCLPNDTIVATASFDNTPDIGQISLLAVNFDFNKSSIKGESKKSINKLLKLMKQLPASEVELRGHTDSLNATGDANYNIKLSQTRADAVRAELIKNGIDQKRIKSIGFGDSRPLADNQTEEGRSKNRRTEFVLIKK